MAIEAWEALERRHRDRQALELPEKIRISILFQLAPEALASDIMKQTTKWTSYTSLRDHLITLQHLRTNGAAPMLYNIEDHESGQGEEEIVSEEGELLRLERRNGKQVAVKAKFPPGVPAPHSQQRPVKRDAECHACGKKGQSR